MALLKKVEKKEIENISILADDFLFFSVTKSIVYVTPILPG
jgi:hypothetical protein